METTFSNDVNMIKTRSHSEVYPSSSDDEFIEIMVLFVESTILWGVVTHQ